jgi:hypothetical protein
LFDEFDTAASNPYFDQAFFGGLRHLSDYRLSYIIASHRTLSDLQFSHPEVIVSPFFNFFHRITLGGFTPNEIDELLATALTGTGITFDAIDRNMLRLWADSHPFFLQMAASFLFDAYRLGHRRQGRVDYQWVEGRLQDNTDEHFCYYWNGSENGEKLILATLSLLEPEELKRHRLYPAEGDPMLRSLSKRVLVVEDEDSQLRPFSIIFARWIAARVSYLPTENVADFKAAVERARVSGFQKAWLDTTERIRKGFAWIDVRAIVKWLLLAKGADSLIEWWDGSITG